MSGFISIRRRSFSSRRWLDRQHNDQYRREAIALGYRSRAAIKLLQLDKKLKLLPNARRAIDLGAAPGSWSQVLARANVRVFAVDVLPMAPIEHVHVIQGSWPECRPELQRALGGELVDLVLSDLSPNRSGVDSLDHARLHDLLVPAFELARETLRPGGVVVVKTLEGEDHRSWMAALRTFATVTAHKPAARRRESRETYIILKDLDVVKFDRRGRDAVRKVGYVE